MTLRFLALVGAIFVLIPSSGFCKDFLENYTPPPMFDEGGQPLAITTITPSVVSPPIPLDRPAQLKVPRSYAMRLLKKHNQPQQHLRVKQMNASDVLKSLDEG